MNSDTNKPVHWDVSNIYPGLESDEFSDAVKLLSQKLVELAKFVEMNEIGRDGVVPEDIDLLAVIVDGYLVKLNEIRAIYRSMAAFLYAFTTTDSFNTVAGRLFSKLQIQGSELWQLEVRFQGWIGLVNAKSSKLEEVLAKDETAGQHAFFLRELAEQSQYLMSEAEEDLAAKLSLSGGSSWGKLQRVITSQLTGHLIKDGQVEELPVTIIQTYRNHPDRSLRQMAYEAELAAWESAREPLAACLNGVKGEVNTLNDRRGRADALDSSLEMARIDRSTLEAMFSAMRDSFPAFRRYWKAKAKILGLQRLPWWDLFAPMGNAERNFTYDEAAGFIIEYFGTFSDRLVQQTQRAFDNSWIDAEPRAGKVGGAFCMSIPVVEESRILCNFDGSLDQVATLAHELGHAYHNHCLEGKTQLQRLVPMTMAETASIFNQTIITDALLAKSASDGEKLGILESFLMDSAQVVVDIYSRYLFETEVFDRREKAELSADELCEIMLRCQRETFGDGLDDRYLHPYMWAWKPHYYNTHRSFYNYPYAFGLLFGLGLYQVYEQGGPGFQQEYDQLLRDSGEHSAADLAARFGIDITQKMFWESSLKVVEGRIDTYERLASVIN